MTKRQILSLLVIIPGAVFVLAKGVYPAFTEIQTDFPNYYTSGIIARTGIGVERLYDDIWFQEQIDANRIAQQGKFSPFPPSTAVLFIPFSLFKPQTALSILTMLNISLLLVSVIVLSRLLAFTLLESTAFVLLSGWGLVNCFRFGQLYIALSLSMLLGFYFYKQKRNRHAGIALGFLAPIKYFPIILISFFAARKRWALVSSSLLTIFFIVGLSVAILGWKIHFEFMQSVFGEHLQSNLSHQTPFVSTYQSFDSLFRRLFVYDAALNPSPIADLRTAYVSLKAGCLVAVCGFASHALRRLWKIHSPETEELSISILTILGRLIAPATATYHYLLLWLPVGILLRHFSANYQTRLFLFTLALYTAIGFLPYSFFLQFDGQGLLTVFAYPRLALLLSLFTVSITAAFLQPQNELKLGFQR